MASIDGSLTKSRVNLHLLLRLRDLDHLVIIICRGFEHTIPGHRIHRGESELGNIAVMPLVVVCE